MFGTRTVASGLLTLSLFCTTCAGTLTVVRLASESRAPIDRHTIPSLLVAHLDSPTLISATFFEDPMPFSGQRGYLSYDYWKTNWGPRGITVQRDATTKTAIVDFGDVLSDDLIALIVDFADRFVTARFIKSGFRPLVIQWLANRTVDEAFALKQAFLNILECPQLAAAVEEASAELGEQEQEQEISVLVPAAQELESIHIRKKRRHQSRH